MPIIDQSFTTGDDDANSLRAADSSQDYLGQQFTPTKSGLVTQINLKLLKEGSPTGNIWTEIWSDTGADLPSAIIGGQSANVDVSTLGATPGALITFTWSTGANIIASTKYWMVLRGDYTRSDINRARWRVDNNASGNGYTGGIAALANSSATWSALATQDLLFEQYYDPSGSGLQSKYW